MESLVTLSLACNILQVITTSQKALAAIKRIREAGAADGSATTYSDSLRALGLELQQSISAQSSTLISDDERELRDRGIAMATIAEQLRALLDEFSSSKRKKVLDVVKYMWKKSRIEDLENGLTQAQDVMQTRILVNLR
jgi:hypothetical protein